METTTVFDIYPAKSQYRPHETVQLIVEFADDCPSESFVDFEIFHHYQSIQSFRVSAEQVVQNGKLIHLGVFSNGGYKVIAKWNRGSDDAMAKTAFDVRDHWREAPRYSFLSDFQPRESYGDIQNFFRKFHLNVVQFYDWMERHDALVPKTPEFIDPMGRKGATASIVSRIEAMREIGAASIGYAAVYASLADYATEHPDEGLYDNKGVQYSLIDLFYLMDISEGSKWRTHILEEFARVIEFGFDGLHLDQYGYPKSARRLDGSVLWMDEAYSSFINACRQRLGREPGLIFNNVSSYPIHSVANAEQDAMYVEVWPPMTRYRHLHDVIERSRTFAAGEKLVILAAYLKPFREKRDADPIALARSALLVTAVIYASGGYHLVLGEAACMLTEPYYPDYVPMAPEMIQPLRRMYDIVTADADLLSSPDVIDVSWSFVGGVNDQIIVNHAPVSPEPESGTVWVRATTTKRGLVIHFVNLLWVQNEDWNAIHDEPFSATPVLDVAVEWNHQVQDIWLQRAEDGIWTKAVWKWGEHGRGEAIHVSVPSFDVWTMMFIPYAATEE